MPQAGRGCSPQGLVQTSWLKYQELDCLLARSMKNTPGSAEVQAEAMIRFQTSRALTTLWTSTGRPADFHFSRSPSQSEL